MAARCAKTSVRHGHGTRRSGVVELTRADSQATRLQRGRPSGGLGVDSKAPSEIQTPAASRSDIARMLFLAKHALPAGSSVLARTKGVPQPLPAGPEPGTSPASRAPKTVLGTPLEVGEPKPRPGAGSALCIARHVARGQGTGGPTGRPTPNQPVGAASTMPLHPLDRKSGPQATPRALGGLKFPPLASLISQLIRGK